MIVQCGRRRSAARAQPSPPLSVLQNFRTVVDDPVAGYARPAPAQRRRPDPAKPTSASVASASVVITGPPDRSSSIVAPNRNRPTTIPLKRDGDAERKAQRQLAG